MKRLLFSFFLLIISSLAYSQLSDGFDDGDFTHNPEWLGYQDHFKINTSYQLQLDNSGESAVSYLQTANQIIDSAQWEFFIKLSFSPSSNNHARVYLVSDNSDLSGSLDGYFLQFGEAGSNDAIELFRQNGDNIFSICRGIEAGISSSFSARMKIIHQLDGRWLVYSDMENTGQYILECQGFDNSISQTSYFGFYCKYTSSNATKFYFDDIEIKHYEPDTQIPEVRSVCVSGEKNLSIEFSEMMNEETAEDLNNYSVNQSIGHPDDAALSGHRVVLTFANDFELNQNYRINISGLSDLSGNMMRDTAIDFSRIELAEYDVVFNEIMADPSPVVQLPNAEYIEIYNRSEASINLKDWKLLIGNSEKTFPNRIIASHSYMILCKESAISALSAYGECIGFSSFSLTNSGQSLTLLAANGMQIHQLAYTDDWYRDADKDDGGWSLEQINPSDFCSEEDNWMASEDERGGSPGTENSVYNAEPVFPAIKSLQISDNPLLLLKFTQQMQTDDIMDKTAYTVSPDIGQANQVMLFDTSRAVYLSFQNSFQTGVEYTLSIHKPMHNCANQAMLIPAEQNFMLSKIAEQGDVVINEIMADPEPVVSLPLYEYLELFNAASAPIDLSNWQLQTGSSIKVLGNILMPPNSYLLLCKPEAEEFFSDFGPVYGISGFSLGNSGAQLVLKNPEGAMIHQIEYSNDWYKDDDKAEGGWSLEAIEPLAYCLERSNWGESIDALGGSPGRINSIDGIADEEEDIFIRRIEILTENTLRLSFNKAMDSTIYGNASLYSIDQGIGMPVLCIIEGPRYHSLILELSTPLEKGKTYQLETSDGLFSCNGEAAGGLSERFALPDNIERGDIVFNEVLFDAAVTDGEFIELVNISDKILETADLSISRLKINQYDTTWYTAYLEGTLLFPGDYVAFASQASQVLKVYHSDAPERIISLASLPSLPNTEATILLHLKSSKDSVIDELRYDESWHYSLLTDTKGVSLEKMNPEGGNGQQNWHSAASTVNYATPAYENSQYQESVLAASRFETNPEVFSPDNDGYDDVLEINYTLDEPGYTLNIVIYDSRGREIRHLVQNELLGTSGSFYWDGQNENSEKAAVGIYILLFEYFDLNGQVKVEKKTVVLGAYL